MVPQGTCFSVDRWLRSTLCTLVRYVNEADRALLQFENIEESYTSATHSYLVGHVKMKELVAKASLLRQTDVFLAAFPED